MSTDDEYKIYFNEEEERQEYEVGVPVHNQASVVLGCREDFRRLISIRLTELLSLTTFKGYALTSGHDGNEVDHLYQQFQEIIDQASKKEALVIQRFGNAKVEKNAQAQGALPGADSNHGLLMMIY